MTDYGKIFARPVPQSEKADDRQKKNNAGGYTFTVSPINQVKRFIILGSEAPTYYCSRREMVVSNAKGIIAAIEAGMGEAIVDLIVDVSVKGRAHRRQPSLFALALVSKYGDKKARQHAHAATSKVARTFTDLVYLTNTRDSLGLGWGRGWKNAVAEWYTSKSGESIAYAATKYIQRDGYTQRDMLRLSHPHSDDPAVAGVLHWIAKSEMSDGIPRIIEGFEKVRSAKKAAEVVALITEYGLTREMVPNQWLNEVSVWEALLVNMPITATIRNLPKMTSIGLLGDFTEAASLVSERLTNEEQLRRGRVHPMSLLVARSTYNGGQGIRGSLSWRPVTRISDSLESAMYLSFGNQPDISKRVLIALDVSGSMSARLGAGMPSVCQAGAVMSLLTLKKAQYSKVVGFAGNLIDLGISAHDNIDSASRKALRNNFGRTDCAQPMLEALNKGMPVDAFIVITDNETWAGRTHPHVALQQYREQSGLDAKLIVWGMTATNFTIADPTDAGMLDVVGFDTAAPNVVGNFIEGGIE